jgi:hypothetical protein
MALLAMFDHLAFRLLQDGVFVLQMHLSLGLCLFLVYRS